jgi:hypothetical protein
MADRWEKFDVLLRELGAIRAGANTLKGSKREHSLEGRAVFAALEDASELVHASLDDEKGPALEMAEAAILRARESLRRAGVVAASNANEAACAVRSAAATKREDARLLRRLDLGPQDD